MEVVGEEQQLQHLNISDGGEHHREVDSQRGRKEWEVGRGSCSYVEEMVVLGRSGHRLARRGADGNMREVEHGWKLNLEEDKGEKDDACG